MKLPIFHSLMRRKELLSLHRKMKPTSKVTSGVTVIQWDHMMGIYHLAKAGIR